MAEKKRVYIIVKTYPTISEKYAELVCTAGILEDGSWIRLYPMPFRKLELNQKYPKYTWVELDAERNTSDFRPETYRPVDLSKINVEFSISKKVDWDERRKIIFNNKKIYTNLDELIAIAKAKKSSLAVFKPTKVLDFIVEPSERDWNPKKLLMLDNLARQMSLFDTPEEIEKEFKVVKKVPYKFSYKFKDETGKLRTMMIEDWEIGMLYFNCLRNNENNEEVAVAKVKEKYLIFRSSSTVSDPLKIQ